MSKFDQKIPIGSVPNGRSQIANRCAIRWFKCKLKPPKKDEDDELDLSFAGLAKQMRLHLNKTQRQRVLNKVTNVIGDCIENVLSGLPLFGVQHLPQANYSQMNIMPQQQVTPQAQPQRAAGGDNLGFYNQMQYGDNELNYTNI